MSLAPLTTPAHRYTRNDATRDGNDMTMPGGIEWIVILIVVLLFFGAKKLPGLANSVGTSLREFRHASHEAMDDDASKSDGGAADGADEGRDAGTTVSRKPDSEG